MLEGIQGDSELMGETLMDDRAQQKIQGISLQAELYFAHSFNNNEAIITIFSHQTYFFSVKCDYIFKNAGNSHYPRVNNNELDAP